MAFFTIIFLAIIIPLIANEEYKRQALFVSLLLLFIPWGLQLEMTQDWDPHLLHWDVANNGVSEVQESREMEVLYMWWMKLFEPFGFFGYLIICAILELGILGYYIRKFVIPQYYWVSIAVLMLVVENGLLMINSNRMSMALIVVMIGVLVLFRDEIRTQSDIIPDDELQTDDETLSEDETLPEDNTGKINYKRLAVFIALIFAAVNIHGAAISAFGLVIIYLLAKKINRMDNIFWLVAMNAFFMLRFVLDARSIQYLGMLYLGGTDLENFDTYIDEIETAETISKVYTPIFFVLMNAILLVYGRMTRIMKFFALALIVKIQMHSFLGGNISRIMQFYYIFSIVVVPYIILLMKDSNNVIIRVIRKPFCVCALLLVIYDFIKNILTSFVYERWIDLTTIFEADFWI